MKSVRFFFTALVALTALVLTRPAESFAAGTTVSRSAGASAGLGASVNDGCVDTYISAGLHQKDGSDQLSMSVYYNEWDYCLGQSLASGAGNAVPQSAELNRLDGATWSGSVVVPVCSYELVPETCSYDEKCVERRFFVVATFVATSEVDDGLNLSRGTISGQQYLYRNSSKHRYGSGSLVTYDVDTNDVVIPGGYAWGSINRWRSVEK